MARNYRICKVARGATMKTIIVVLSAEDYTRLLAVLDFVIETTTDGAQGNTAVKELKNTLQTSIRVNL